MIGNLVPLGNSLYTKGVSPCSIEISQVGTRLVRPGDPGCSQCARRFCRACDSHCRTKIRETCTKPCTPTSYNREYHSMHRRLECSGWAGASVGCYIRPLACASANYQATNDYYDNEISIKLSLYIFYILMHMVVCPGVGY